MATLREAIYSTLSGDSALAGLLVGGVLKAEGFKPRGGGISQAPRAADGVAIQPFAVIVWGASQAMGPIMQIGAEVERLEVYVYQHAGFEVIDPAINRIKALLHDQYFDASDRALAHSAFQYISGETVAEELLGASCRFIRFYVYQIRG